MARRRWWRAVRGVPGRVRLDVLRVLLGADVRADRPDPADGRDRVPRQARELSLAGALGLGLLRVVVRPGAAARCGVRERGHRGAARQERGGPDRQPPRPAASVRPVPGGDDGRDAAHARRPLPGREDGRRSAGARATMGSPVHRPVHPHGGDLGRLDRGRGLRRDGHVHGRRVDDRVPAGRAGRLRADDRDGSARPGLRRVLRQLRGALPLARDDLGRPVPQHAEVVDEPGHTA